MADPTCVFLGGKQIGPDCLKRLLGRGIVPRLVIGNPNDTGKNKSWHQSLVRVARENGLATLVRRKVKDPAVVKKIKRINPEIIFCIGGTQIIPKEILKIPRLGCLNIHSGLLPKYRGRYATAHAIFNEEAFAGVTLHWMDERIDSGPVIMQGKITIDQDDTAKSLYHKFTKLGTKLFTEFLRLWLNGRRIPSRPQDERKTTYYPRNLPNGGEIDWTWSGTKIRAFLRAMTFEPFPPASFKIGRKRMVVVDEKYFKGFR